MAKKPLKEIYLSIDSLTSKGFGSGIYASSSGSKAIVEVPHALPGDEVQVLLGRKRGGICQGMTPKIVSPSPLRVKPRCRHASYCGGCSIQAMDYGQQLLHKQKMVQHTFSSLCNPELIRPILACDEPWYYRNKMEYSFSQDKAGHKYLGLIMSGSRGKVFSLDECHLTEPWYAKACSAVYAFWQNSSLQAYHSRSNTGSLRTLTLRSSKYTECKMAFLTVSGNPDYRLMKKDLEGFVAAIQSATENRDTLSIFIRIQQTLKGFTTQFYEMHLAGPDHILEHIHLPTQSQPLYFKISPTAFFQPNTRQAEKLYNAAASLLQGAPPEHLLDLYAGTSTLGIVFSKIAKKVTSIEINPHATFDAEVNKELNGAVNLEVCCGDVADVLLRLREDPNFSADVVVVDPPRAGLSAEALMHIISLSPQKIIYVSCNITTQASNICSLVDAGYAIAAVQPVDQFPHTIHLENIILLRKKE